MRKQLHYSVLIFAFFSIFSDFCRKEHDHDESPYDLDVILRGESNESGHGEDNPSGLLGFVKILIPIKSLTWISGYEIFNPIMNAFYSGR